MLGIVVHEFLVSLIDILPRICKNVANIELFAQIRESIYPTTDRNLRDSGITYS